MNKPIKAIDTKQAWQLINQLIRVKRTERPGCLVLKQSMPETGVWIDDSFYSIDHIINHVNKQNKFDFVIEYKGR
jgi:hypothetical protein